MVDLNIDVEKYKEWLFYASMRIHSYKSMDANFLLENWEMLKINEWEDLYREFESKETKERLGYWFPDTGERDAIEYIAEANIENERNEFEKKCERSALSREKMAKHTIEEFIYRFDSFYTTGTPIPLKLLKISKEDALMHFANDLVNYHTAIYLKGIIDGSERLSDSVEVKESDENTCFKSKKHLEVFIGWLVDKRVITKDLRIPKGNIKPNSWIYGFVTYAKSLQYVDPGTTVRECYDELAERFGVSETNMNKLTKAVRLEMEAAKHSLPDHSKI